MKKIRIILLILMILINSILTAGCWNYREIDKLAIIAGAAFDKGANGQYIITAEVVQIGGERNAKTTSKTLTMEGKTLFDAVRNGIALSGKKLYWSHTKVIILSKEIASEGIVKVIDWYTRDAETRNDIYILISQEESAGGIFNGQGATDEIMSFVLEEVLKNQKNLSKALGTNILQFANDLEAEGISAVVPAISLKKSGGKMLPQIAGTAIFNNDKLVGFLNGEETKDLMFIKNKVKGGLLIEEENDISTPASLEIYESKTRVTPVADDKDIKINLNIDVKAAIAEIEGTEDFIEGEGRIKLEQSAEKKLKKRIESLIEKIQSKYGTDIFGFGAKLRERDRKVWNQVSNNWEEVFKNIEVNVTTKVRIRNSAILSKPLKDGD